jgi:chromosome segregation ATPase
MSVIDAKKIDNLTRQLSETEKRRNELENMSVLDARKIENLTRQLNGSRKDPDDAVKRLEEVSRQLEERDQKIIELTSVVKSLKSDIGESRAKLKSASDLAVARAIEIKSVREELASALQKCEEFDRFVEDNESKLREFEIGIAEIALSLNSESE